MELVLLLLVSALRRRRASTYTREQLEAVARDRAQEETRQGLAPAISAPQRPYRWWRYEGLC
jgi:hypothetical protein